MTEKTGTEISEAMDNDFKYSKEDILQICNVSERTFRSFLASQILTDQDFISVGSSHKQFYKENVLKQFQAWLMYKSDIYPILVDFIISKHVDFIKNTVGIRTARKECDLLEALEDYLEK